MRRDRLPVDGPVGRDEVDQPVREAGLLEDAVDGVVGQHGRVARLPHHAVALIGRRGGGRGRNKRCLNNRILAIINRLIILRNKNVHFNYAYNAVINII